MPFKKGRIKTGGRQKGINVTKSVAERVSELGVDLVNDFIRDLALIEKPEIRNDQRLKLMQFIHPKAEAPKVETTLEVSYRTHEDLGQLPTAHLLEQYFKLKGEDHAVQKQSPNGLDVRQQAENGQAVGKGRAVKGFEFAGSQGFKTED